MQRQHTPTLRPFRSLAIASLVAAASLPVPLASAQNALGDGRAGKAFRALAEVIFTEAAPPVDMAGCSARMLAAAEKALDAAEAST